MNSYGDSDREQIAARLDRMYMKCTETHRARTEGYDMSDDYVTVRAYVLGYGGGYGQDINSGAGKTPETGNNH